MTTYVIQTVPEVVASYTPYGGARDLIYSQDHEVIIYGAAETGKTLAACWKIHLLASKYPRSQGAIIRKTQRSVYGSVLQTFSRVIQHAPIEVYGGERPEKFTYANGSVIWVGGLDNPDKILSSERDFIYVNQAEELSEADWEMLLTRVTGRSAVIPHPQLIGDCNPSGSHHWIRRRASLRLIRSTHQDNPTLFDPITGQITAQGETTLAILSSLTGVRRKRLYEGLWVTAEGMVYDMFDADTHVRARQRSDFQRFIMAMDEGYTNPAVILDIGVDGDGRMHIFREFYRRGVLQRDVVRTAQEWFAESSHSLIAVDAAAAGLIADLRDAGLPAQGYKGRVLDGITAVQARLAVQGDGMPRLTIDPECVETINEFESYVWKPNRDEPVDENDHAMDALRYGVIALTGSVMGGIYV